MLIYMRMFNLFIRRISEESTVVQGVLEFASLILSLYLIISFHTGGQLVNKNVLCSLYDLFLYLVL